MKLGDISLFLSCSSTFALIIPEKQRRDEAHYAHVLRQIDPPSGAPTPGVATPSTTPLDSAPAASSSKSHPSKNMSSLSNSTRLSHLAYFQAPVDLCDYGIIDCPVEDHGKNSNDEDDDNDQSPVNGTISSHNVTSRAIKQSRLGKRGAPREFDVWDGFTIKSVPYLDTFRLERGPRAGKLPHDVLDFQDPTDMDNAEMVNTHDDTRTFKRVTEHPVEEQTIPEMLRYMGGNDATTKQGIEKLYNAKITKEGLEILTKEMPWVAKLKNPTFGEVLWHAGGSTTHPVPNLPTEKDVNSGKEAFWSQEKMKDTNKLKNLRDQIVSGEAPSNRLMSFLRMVIGVGKYINHPDITARFKLVYGYHDFLMKNAEKLTNVKVVDSSGQAVKLDVKLKEFTKREATNREKFLNDYMDEFISKDTVDAYDTAITRLEGDIQKLRKQPSETELSKTLTQEYNTKLAHLNSLNDQQKDLWQKIMKVDEEVNEAKYGDMQSVRSRDDWDALTTKQWKDIADNIKQAEEELQSIQMQLDKIDSKRLEQFRDELRGQRDYIKTKVTEIKEVVKMPDITAPVEDGFEKAAFDKLMTSTDLLAGKSAGDKRPLDDIVTQDTKPIKKTELRPDLGVTANPQPEEDMTSSQEDELRKAIGMDEKPGRVIPIMGGRPPGGPPAGGPPAGPPRTGPHRA